MRRRSSTFSVLRRRWTPTASAATSTRASTAESSLVPDRLPAGLLDTSVVIDLQLFTAEQLPVESAIAAVTLAELTAGPLATDDPVERAVRQDRLQRTEAAFDPIPFGGAAAR